MGNVEILHKSYLIFAFFHALKSKITKTVTVVFTVRCKKEWDNFFIEIFEEKSMAFVCCGFDHDCWMELHT